MDVWLDPTMDPERVPQKYLDDLYAGEIGENLPYRSEFDNRALRHRLQPGEASSRPHNGPQQIVNIDMNVSLATRYTTPVVYQRQYVQLANRFILRNLKVKNRSRAEHGLILETRCISYREINKVRPFKRGRRLASDITDLQLNPDASLGLRKLPIPRLASSARKTTRPSGSRIPQVRA
jgi:hypothetical protein